MASLLRRSLIIAVLILASANTSALAKHYRINSVSEINPRVLKALEAKIAAKLKRGPVGPAGQNGTNGAPGKDGVSSPGTPGQAGAEGKQGLPGEPGKEGAEGKPSLTAEEAEKLKAILPYVSLSNETGSGHEFPTIRFTGVNMQINGGESSDNGLGNLIIGHNAEAEGLDQSGSDNIILGYANSWTSNGSIVGGEGNTDQGSASIVFGLNNHTTAHGASVLGGSSNHAEGLGSAILGGKETTLTEEWAHFP